MKPLIFFATLLVFGCSTKKSIVQTEKEIIYLTYELDCRKTLSEVKKVWKNYESKLCCLYDKDLIERLKVNTNCFNGFTKDEVKNYFGIPMVESNNQLSYLIYSDCSFNSVSSMSSRKYSLHFYFICENHATDKVTSCIFVKPRGYILH